MLQNSVLKTWRELGMELRFWGCPE